MAELTANDIEQSQRAIAARVGPRERPLTDREKRFVDFYLASGNVADAYQKAGYTCKNIETARSGGNTKLHNYHVFVAIEKKRKELAESRAVTVERVVDEIAKVAFGNIADYLEFDANGVYLRPSVNIPPDKLAAIAEVAEVRSKDGGGVRFKLHDKLSALTALAKVLGLYVDKTELTGANGAPLPVVVLPAIVPVRPQVQQLPALTASTPEVGKVPGSPDSASLPLLALPASDGEAAQ